MNWFRMTVLWVLIVGWLTVPVLALSPTPEEMALAKEWTKANLGPKAKVLPFSFTYADQSSANLLKKWKTERTSKKLDEHRTQTTITYTEYSTNLEVLCVLVEYNDFPTVEWTLYFKNQGNQDSSILSEIKALDTSFAGDEKSKFVLHHHNGDGVPDPFKPLVTRLGQGKSIHLAPNKGRSSEGVWPYFNVEWPGNSMILAIGWPGQWEVDFTHDQKNGLHVQAGQELTHFKLHPGEEVRSPRIVLQFAKVSDWIEAQNIWRRWMIAHNMPRPGGKIPEPILAGSSAWQYGEMAGANEENQKMFIDRYLEAGIDLDYWWMDAGWFVYKYNVVSAHRWEADRKRFPNGMRVITDHARTKGLKSILWFIPEQVPPDSWLWENHPEWLLGPDPEPDAVFEVGGWSIEGHSKVLNFGNPQAWQWLVEHFDKIIKTEKFDIYRNDLGMQLAHRILDCWRLNEPEDRQGINEIKHVTGFLAFYDELRRRHPHLLIDNCAAGGKRNDVDTMRRSIVLWRTDTWHPSTKSQSYTYGLAFWLPYFGSAAPSRPSPYTFRSNMLPSTVLTLDMRNPDEKVLELTRRLVKQRQQVVANFFGDFYPLTKYSTTEDTWIAWQFHRPEAGEGMVQAFRRSKCKLFAGEFPLRGLQPDAQYEIHDLDQPGRTRMAGKDLMEKGLTIQIPDKPGAVVFAYRKVE